jgi:large subunit ribosomal protein L29
MEASELRQFSVDELKSRVKQWQDELFRSRFKAQSAEARDTSIFKKLRKDIARGLTILSEKEHGIEIEAAPQDQGAHPEGSELAAAAKPAKKATKSKKGTKKTKKVAVKKGAKTKKAKGVKKHAR